MALPERPGTLGRYPRSTSSGRSRLSPLQDGAEGTGDRQGPVGGHVEVDATDHRCQHEGQLPSGERGSDTAAGTAAEWEVPIFGTVHVPVPPGGEPLRVRPEPFIPMGDPLGNQELCPGGEVVTIQGHGLGGLSIDACRWGVQSKSLRNDVLGVLELVVDLGARAGPVTTR